MCVGRVVAVGVCAVDSGCGNVWWTGRDGGRAVEWADGLVCVYLCGSGCAFFCMLRHAHACLCVCVCAGKLTQVGLCA